AGRLYPSSGSQGMIEHTIDSGYSPPSVGSPSMPLPAFRPCLKLLDVQVVAKIGPAGQALTEYKLFTRVYPQAGEAFQITAKRRFKVLKWLDDRLRVMFDYDRFPEFHAKMGSFPPREVVEANPFTRQVGLREYFRTLYTSQIFMVPELLDMVSGGRFTELLAPIYETVNVLSSGRSKKYVWSQEAATAVGSITEATFNIPLKQFAYNETLDGTFAGMMDASDMGCSAALHQLGGVKFVELIPDILKDPEGSARVSLYTRSITRCESGYNVYEKESLALALSCRPWTRLWLITTNFSAITHSAGVNVVGLNPMRGMKQLNAFVCLSTNQLRVEEKARMSMRGRGRYFT
ncbi:hypothetical protein FOZ62_031003, partial [Perkinsus olseni]